MQVSIQFVEENAALISKVIPDCKIRQRIRQILLVSSQFPYTSEVRKENAGMLKELIRDARPLWKLS